MSNQFNPPLNANPGDYGSLSAAIQFVMRSFAKELDSCLPAIVQEFDRAKNIATVRPLIAHTLRDKTKISRPPIVEIPVISLGAGGFHISFPIKPGDLGWIFAADRDTSLFLQSLDEQAANTTRAHCFSDGFFIPDVYRQYSIDGEDAEFMVIQSTDGASRISIRPDNIKITTPLSVTIDTPDTFITGKLTVDGATLLKSTLVVMGGATFNSGFASNNSAGGGTSTANALHVTGNTQSGSVVVDSHLEVAGVTVEQHDHISGAPGADTGPMK